MSVATFKPGPTEGQDTYLDITPKGDSVILTMFWGPTGRVLIKFDISSIPSNAVCTSAVLGLWGESGISGSTWTAYSILSGNSTWDENATYATKDGTNAWAGSDGCSTSGTDYNGTSIGSLTWANNNNEQTMTLTTATVQSWINNSSTNHGILFLSNAVAYNWSITSSDYTLNSIRRPKLTVNYNPVTLQRRTIAPSGTGIGKRQAQS